MARLIAATYAAVTTLIISHAASAADKTIVVIEKSDNKECDTNHAQNRTGLPAGAKGVEASSLDDAVTKILAELGAGDCIKRLDFRGHGGPGVQGVGDGVKYDDDKHINTGAAKWKTKLAGLKGKFCANAVINLWGCNVGSCDKGATKLKELADEFGVTVRGAVNTVNSGEQEKYSGPIQEAKPNQPKPAHKAAATPNAPKSSGEGCSGPARSARLVDPNSSVQVEFASSSTCTIHPPSLVGGIQFTTTPIDMPFQGSLTVAFQSTTDPAVLRMAVTDTSRLAHPTFPAAGHQIRIVDVSFLFQDFQFRRNLPADNVAGPYTARIDFIVDGVIPLTLFEKGDLVATFEASTGNWPEFAFQTLFTRISTCDIDADEDIDSIDIDSIFRARNTTARSGDPRDADGDGRITVNDARVCANRCTRPLCVAP